MVAACYAELNVPDKATSYIEKAIILAPGDIELMFRAAEIYMTIGEKEKSLNYLEKLLQQGYSLQRIQQSLALQELLSEERIQKLLKNQPL